MLFCFDSFFLGGGALVLGWGYMIGENFYDYYIHKQKKHMCTIVSKWIVSLCYRRDNFDFLGFSLCNICLFLHIAITVDCHYKIINLSNIDSIRLKHSAVSC